MNYTNTWLLLATVKLLKLFWLLPDFFPGLPTENSLKILSLVSLHEGP